MRSSFRIKHWSIPGSHNAHNEPHSRLELWSLWTGASLDCGRKPETTNHPEYILAGHAD